MSAAAHELGKGVVAVAGDRSIDHGKEPTLTEIDRQAEPLSLGASASDPSTWRQLRGTLILFGVGMGAFVDGIVLHQILQWHHMLTATGDHPSTTVAGIEANTLADGLFHAFAWLLVLVAGIRLARARSAGIARPPVRVIAGNLLIGWGGFNIVEGLVDHHLLSVHHVRDDVADPFVWDVSFLALSVLLVALGLALSHSKVDAGKSAGPPTQAARVGEE